MKVMKKSVALWAFALVAVLSAKAQNQPQLEVGFLVGGANYLGDIGGHDEAYGSIRDLRFDQTAPTAGVFLALGMHPRVTFKTNLNFVQIKGDDANCENDARRARNLNFRNRMIELGLTVDYKYFTFRDLTKEGSSNPAFTTNLECTVFGGFYGVLHNPMARVTYDPNNIWEDRYYELRPLRTEGQLEEYSRLIAAIPFGFGFNLNVRNNWKFGIEASYRTTFTDYLDDVSTTYGDPSKMDPLAQALSLQSNDYVIALIYGPDSGRTPPQYTESGTQRGNPLTNDGYGTIQFTVSKVLKTSSRNTGRSF
jgi:hypothetical protein